MKKHKKKSNKSKVFLKVFLSILIVGLVLVTCIFTALSFGIIDTTKDLNIENYNMSLSSYVYYQDEDTGDYKQFERLYADENRTLVKLSKIPEHVQNAAIAIEDERFRKHKGVDIASTLKATAGYIFKNSTARGGSTITQQLVKNLTGDREKNITRKITEIFKAIQLEQKLTKDEILEMYLNTIYLGEGCNGIQSAANFYFGKDVSKLTVAEGACLVGITQYPSLYDPLVNPDKNKEKQLIVLNKMLDLKYIDKATYNDAIEEPLKFTGKANELLEGKQSYFVDQVIDDVLTDLVKEGYTKDEAIKLIYSGGLKIYSTVDPEIQKVATDVFADDNNLSSGPNGKPQASMCVIDPKTGEIKALIGGFGKKTASRAYNRATQSKRQPGSSIKPIAVYAPAIEENIITPYSIYQDKKITIADWSPKNYYSGFKGSMTIKYAVEQSTNTVAVQVLQELGINKSYKFLTNKLGITTLVEDDKNLAALALGGLTNGLTNKEITAAYSAFANGGTYIKPITYTKVLDSSGKVIIENKKVSHKAMSKETAKTVNGLLKSVCDYGTGTAARFGSYTIAGKTGTTDDDKDRWFVGYTPYYCAAVWVGYDTPASLDFYTSNPTIPLWKKVMEKVHSIKKLPTKSFEYTALYGGNENSNNVSILEGKICTESGLKATSSCPSDKVISSDTSNISGHCTIHSSKSKTTNEELSSNSETTKPSAETTHTETNVPTSANGL